MDLRVIQVEEVMRLHHLESLVHERRGIDRDLRAHRPHGVLERLLHRCPSELVAGPPAERTAGTREHHALQVLATLVAERHRQRGVLGVHREQAFRFPLHEVGDELAADHQRLLVRERQRLARLERREGRGEAGGADERVQDEVTLGVTGEDLGGVRTDDQLDALRGPELLLHDGRRFLVRDRDRGRKELPDLPHEQLEVHPRGRQADHAEPVGMAARHVEGLGADRAGRPEDGQRPHA